MNGKRSNRITRALAAAAVAVAAIAVVALAGPATASAAQHLAGYDTSPGFVNR
jgi:hypothetical protein